jgi:pimeloyl-ACP methyl ester carboxylesterase
LLELHHSVGKVFSTAKKNNTFIQCIYGGNRDQDLPAVIFTHGWPQTSVADQIFMSNRGMFDALINAGYTIYAPYTGANWGHPTISSPSNGGTALVAFDDALALAEDYGHPDGEAHLFGVSMGGCNALNWGWRNPAKVLGVYLYAPLVDFSGTYSLPLSEALLIPEALRAVHGGTDKATFLTASAACDPVRNYASVSFGSRVSIFGITQDEVIPFSSLEIYAGIIKATLTSSPGSHFFGGTTNFREHDIVRWFAQHE